MFTLTIIALIFMLFPLGFAAERVFSKRPIPQGLLVTTSAITGLWSGLATAELLGGLVVGTGICAFMLIGQRYYNRRFLRNSAR